MPKSKIRDFECEWECGTVEPPSPSQAPASSLWSVLSSSHSLAHGLTLTSSLSTSDGLTSSLSQSLILSPHLGHRRHPVPLCSVRQWQKQTEPVKQPLLHRVEVVVILCRGSRSVGTRQSGELPSSFLPCSFTRIDVKSGGYYCCIWF
ncbi:uncharacterized protein DS421_9g270710 [Arachis hypogaea]|nr:uncharacterized protein DS421_9g270710 [Arachis hypogaea]